MNDITNLELQVTKAVREKWKPIIESRDEDGTDLGFGEIQGRSAHEISYKKKLLALCLENVEKESSNWTRATRPLQESMNTTAGIDITDPLLIKLVRRMAPNLLAYDIVGVQPMNGPTGTIFAMRYFYNAQPTGPFGRPGDARPGRQAGSDVDSNDDTTAEQWGVAGVAPDEALYYEADTTFTGAGTQSRNDDTIDYDTYEVGMGMSTFDAERLGGSGSNDGVWAEMSLTIDKRTVTAGERAVKAKYTVELIQDMSAAHGLDAEDEITHMLSTEMLAEENREIINRLRFTARIAAGEKVFEDGVVKRDSAGAIVLGNAGEFDIQENSDGRIEQEKFSSLIMKVNKEANQIAKDTRRGRGNFIIASSNVASALDLAGKLKFAPAIDNNLNVDDTGNTFVGILQNKFRVYIDPYITFDEIIVGYKGVSQMDAGMFYCPYVPLQKYPATDPNTLQPIMGLKSRYGVAANPMTTTKRNNNTYYRKFRVRGI